MKPTLSWTVKPETNRSELLKCPLPPASRLWAMKLLVSLRHTEKRYSIAHISHVDRSRGRAARCEEDIEGGLWMNIVNLILQNKRKEKKTTTKNKRKEKKTKRNKTKQNETKRNETKRNETKRNETKQNKTKQNKTKQQRSIGADAPVASSTIKGAGKGLYFSCLFCLP